MPTDAIKDGIYEGVPMEEYRAWPLPSYSRLKTLCLGGTPAHYAAGVEADDNGEDDKPSKSMDVGTWVHAALLEPHLLDQHQPLPDTVKRRAGEAWIELQAENPGVNFYPPSEWADLGAKIDKARAVADAVREHPVAGQLFQGGKSEVSMVWTDPDYGIQIKGRLDYLGGGNKYIADLKTYGLSRSLHLPMSQYQVIRGAYSRGAAVQAAMYSDGLRTILKREYACPFWFCFVEVEKPYLITCVNGLSSSDERRDMDEDGAGYYKHGRDHYKAALRTIQRCEADGVWPGFGLDVLSMVIPKYAEEAV